MIPLPLYALLQVFAQSQAERDYHDSRADHYAETGVMFPGGSYDEGSRP